MSTPESSSPAAERVIPDGLIRLDPESQFDCAIVGVATLPNGYDVLIYSIDKVLEALIDGGMPEDAVEEYFDFNIAGAYLGESTPIFIDVASIKTAFPA